MDKTIKPPYDPSCPASTPRVAADSHPLEMVNDGSILTFFMSNVVMDGNVRVVFGDSFEVVWLCVHCFVFILLSISVNQF